MDATHSTLKSCMNIDVEYGNMVMGAEDGQKRRTEL